MHDVRWDRAAVAREVADRLWTMLSGQAGYLSGHLPQAAAVLQLSRPDLTYLRALHLALSPEAGALLAAAPTLLRTLRTSTSSVLDTHPERLRGPVAWTDTYAQWGRTGYRAGYATRPVQRDYDTPENRLLAASLRALSTALGEVLDLVTAGPVGRVLASRTAEAEHALATPVLRHITARPAPADLRRVERGRRKRQMAPVTRFWKLTDRLTRLQDQSLLRAMIERAALVSTDTGSLMESLVLFRAWDVAQAAGWTAERPRLVRGRIVVHFKRGEETLVLHYQQVSPSMAGRYATLLRQHGLPVSSLRPDLVIERTYPHSAKPMGGDRAPCRVVVEVKYRQRAHDAARAALHDLLAYRENYRGMTALPSASTPARTPVQGSLFDTPTAQHHLTSDRSTHTPTATQAQATAWLGVVWGEGLAPQLEAEVWLCSYDQLEAGLLPLVK